MEPSFCKKAGTEVFQLKQYLFLISQSFKKSRFLTPEFLIKYFIYGIWTFESLISDVKRCYEIALVYSST